MAGAPRPDQGGRLRPPTASDRVLPGSPIPSTGRQSTPQGPVGRVKDSGDLRTLADSALCPRPAEVFTEQEAAALLPLSLPYDVPVFSRVKVHRDFHVDIGRALYSAPQAYLSAHPEARADSALVKLFHHGQLVKTHPRQPPGRRSTDPADLPAEKTIYAMRDVASLAAMARRHGDAVGAYADQLLDTDLPWTKMRQVNRLLGLVRRYGPGPVGQACARALDLDVIKVTKIASMLEKATENTPPPPRPAAAAAARFARDLAEYRPVQLALIDGGKEARR